MKLPNEGLLRIPKKGDGIPSYYSGSEKALFEVEQEVCFSSTEPLWKGRAL